MIDLDGTPNKSRLGPMLSLVSLYRWLRQRRISACLFIAILVELMQKELPVPFMNILNRKHADSGGFTEFMIVPVGE